MKNEVISLVREDKNEYISKFLNTLVDNTIPPGKWWGVAKSICQIKNRTTTSSPINANNNIMTHHFDKSNALNEYVTSISTLHNEHELPNLPQLSHCELSDIVITEKRCTRSISNLKNKEATRS